MLEGRNRGSNTSGQNFDNDSSSVPALSSEGSVQAQIDFVLSGLNSDYSRTQFLFQLKDSGFAIDTVQLVRNLENVDAMKGDYLQAVGRAGLDPQTEHRLRNLYLLSNLDGPELAKASGQIDLAIELYSQLNNHGEVARLKQERGDATPLDIALGIDHFERRYKFESAYDLAKATHHVQRAERSLDNAMRASIENGRAFTVTEQLLQKAGDETRLAMFRSEALVCANRLLQEAESVASGNDSDAVDVMQILDALRVAQKGNRDEFSRSLTRTIDFFDRRELYAAAFEASQLTGDDFQQMEYAVKAARQRYHSKDFDGARVFAKKAGWSEMEQKALLAEIDLLAEQRTFVKAVKLARDHGLDDRVEMLYEQATTDPFVTNYIDLLLAAEETGSIEKIIPVADRYVKHFAKTDKEKQVILWHSMMARHEEFGDYALAKACAEHAGDANKAQIYELALQLLNRQKN